MSTPIRNRSVLNRRSSDVKVMPFNEILLSDKTDFEFHFKTLVNHLLANSCPQNKCHDLCQQLTQINDYILSPKDLEPFSKQLDRFLIGFNLLTVEEEVVDKYCQIIYTLCDLKPFKLEPILKDVIIEKFKGFKDFFGETEIQSKELIVFDRFHSILKRLKLSNLTTKLLSCLKTRFPPMNGPNACVHTFVCYVHNILKICDYIPNRVDLLEMTFEKILEFDSMFLTFTTKTKSSANYSFDVNKANDIVDHMMQILVTYIEDKLKDKTEEELKETFELFEEVFIRVMFGVEGFTHLVYIWLYLCSLSNTFSDQFIQFLWDFGLNDDNSMEKREKALNFCVFLIKNSNFLSIDQIIAFMNMTSNWIHNYIDENDRITEDMTQNDSIFFIICQNLFDIFCSIHSDLDNLRLRRIKVMNFQRIIRCKLNPLELCSQEIESQFLNLARHYQIGYCPLNESSDENRLDSPIKPLYYLPKTRTQMEAICRDLIDGHNYAQEIERIHSRRRNNSLNNSDESDYCNRSYSFNSKSLLQNQLSDSSLNELIDY